MKNLLPGVSGLLLALGCLALSSCDDSETQVSPVTAAQTVSLELGMSGYAAEPATIARFGVAATQEDALKGRGTLLTGKISYVDTKGGKETKPFSLADQPKGTTRWVYISAARKPSTNQKISLNWNITDMLTLTASSADTIVVKELVVQ